METSVNSRNPVCQTKTFQVLYLPQRNHTYSLLSQRTSYTHGQELPFVYLSYKIQSFYIL